MSIGQILRPVRVKAWGFRIESANNQRLSARVVSRESLRAMGLYHAVLLLATLALLRLGVRWNRVRLIRGVPGIDIAQVTTIATGVAGLKRS